MILPSPFPAWTLRSDSALCRLLPEKSNGPIPPSPGCATIPPVRDQRPDHSLRPRPPSGPPAPPTPRPLSARPIRRTSAPTTSVAADVRRLKLLCPSDRTTLSVRKGRSLPTTGWFLGPCGPDRPLWTLLSVWGFRIFFASRISAVGFGSPPPASPKFGQRQFHPGLARVQASLGQFRPIRVSLTEKIVPCSLALHPASR